MENRDFATCLLCFVLTICILIGLLSSAFIISDKMVDNAVMQLQETQKRVVQAYRITLSKYRGNGNHGADLGNTTQNSMNFDSDTIEPVDTGVVETEPVLNSTGDGEPSTGDDSKTDDNNTIENIADSIMTPDADSEPKSDDTVHDENEDEIFVEYTVKSGDTMSAIARRYGVSVNVIAEFNGIENVDRIREGQTLVIPTVENWNDA